MKNFYNELRPSSGETFQVYIQSARTHDHNPTPPHIHDFVEVLYCLNGSYYLCVNDFETTFSVGDMIVIGSKSIHELTILEGEDGEFNGDFLAIKFQPEMIYSGYSSTMELKYVLPFIYNSANSNYFFKKEQIENTKLKDVFDNIKNMLQTHEYGFEIALKSDIYQVIFQIVRILHSSKSIWGDFSPAVIKKLEIALNYIENNYNQPISIKELSDLSFMTYSYFSHLFKQLTGLNCTAYINRIRVKKSEPMLMSENMSISKISDLVGFDNVSYYIKQFKLFNGVSPKQYQKTLLSAKND